jgi:hypothetical protein
MLLVAAQIDSPHRRLEVILFSFSGVRTSQPLRTRTAGEKDCIGSKEAIILVTFTKWHARPGFNHNYTAIS